MEVAEATLCEKVQIPKGQSLPTAAGRTRFLIAEVNDRRVEVVPHSTGKMRPIYCQEFERAEALGLAHADVTPSQLRQAGASEGNPAYVAAIIRAVVRGMTPA
jgi:hypothetical protein